MYVCVYMCIRPVNNLIIFFFKLRMISFLKLHTCLGRPKVSFFLIQMPQWGDAHFLPDHSDH